MEWATVLTSRAPERVDELDINAGDFVKVIQKFGDGWFQGSLRGHVGLAPTTHVKMHRQLYPVRVEHSYESQLPDELNLDLGDIVNVLDDDLEDAGWWLGELGGKVGLFPNNFVEKIHSTPLNHAVIRKKARSNVPPIPQSNLYEEINQTIESGDAQFDRAKPQGTPDSKFLRVEVAEAEAREIKEELAKIRFSFEWFSMRHAKTVSQLVDEIEDGKKVRKKLENDINELSMMAAHRFN